MRPGDFYAQRNVELARRLTGLLQKKSQLGWGRFLVMTAVLLAAYLALQQNHLYAIPAIALLVAFVRLVYADLDNNRAILEARTLLAINEEELTALSGNYLHFEDGAEHAPHEHLYANDLDLFGRASLFQYLNRTTSEMGSATLANWLLQPAPDIEILRRQDAVKELATTNEWRQELRAVGKLKKITTQTRERLHNWISESSVFAHGGWKMLRYLVPVVVLSVIALNIFNVLTDATRNYFLLASALIAYYISRRVIPLHYQVSRMAEELAVLSDSIRLVENAEFTGPLLQELHGSFSMDTGTASDELKMLRQILARLDYRLNPVVFIPLAVLLQWDLQQVLSLENWKRRNQQNVRAWFDALGNFEALSSLATLHFNHPAWCFPAFRPDHFYIEGEDIGHALIHYTKRVDNPIRIEHRGELMLITGSNMAGKSTYLRSIGTNVVLAMAGSVVCARRFCLSPVQLITSMRVADNLEENTSTFYAELKKLKKVIDLVNADEKVFVLLDEILRGTNSLDRHTGSIALTKQLIRHRAAAIIATHDIELARLRDAFPANILNFHFDAQVSNDELYFDYRLREGICKSINASLLMKKIGIEL